MCGRYTLTTQKEDLIRALDLPPEAFPHALEPRYNIAPTEPVPVVLREDAFRVRLLRWGLVPAWARGAAAGAGFINARRETIAAKPAFRDAFREGRGLMPADGFYEWLPVGGRRPKVPHYIRLRTGEPFTFAALAARGRRGDDPGSCAIVTGEANELVRRVHDRMPMIIDPDDRDAWLDPDNRDEAGLLAMLRPYDPGRMEMWPVSRYVNSVDHDDERCIRPADPDEEEQPTLF